MPPEADEILAFTDASGAIVAQLALSEIMGLNLGEVEAVAPGFYIPPVGVYRFRGKSIEQFVHDGKPAFSITQTITAVHSMARDGDPNEPIGKDHREAIFWPYEADLTMANLATFLGYLKYTLEKMGLEGTAPVAQLNQLFEGHEFDGPIKHDVDKKNSDRKFPRLVLDSIRPVSLGVEQLEQPAQAAEAAPEQAATAAA
jgi:hypothetical protein